MENNNVVQSPEVLIALIDEICGVSQESFLINVEKYAHRFIYYYRSGGYNIYSPTYKWVSQTKQENFEYIVIRLSYIQKYLEARKLEPQYFEKFIKLKDYLILEISRSTDNSEMRKIIANAKATEKEIKLLKTEIETKQKDSLSQTITILSIFTGIAMAFFGGFSMLSGAFGSLRENDVSLTQVAIISIIIGIVLFNTIFSFIYMAAKVSGRSITTTGHNKCSECNRINCCENKGFEWFKPVKKGFKKYPYIFFVNILLIVLLIAFIIKYECIVSPKLESNDINNSNEIAKIIDSSEELPESDISNNSI